MKIIQIQFKKNVKDSDLEFPIQRYYQILVGMIGIQPSEFWDMSVYEVSLAIKGFREYNTGKTEKPMDKGDLEKMKEMYPDV